MQRCHECGQPIEFRFIDGRCIPLHSNGGCRLAVRSSDEGRIKRFSDSECRKTRCPECSEDVYFLRHNGGSVWIEPPLGPPWDVHRCFEKKNAAVPEIQKKHPTVAMTNGTLSAGVVRMTEISKDRRQTILHVSLPEPDGLTVLVRGGADALIGQLIEIDSTAKAVVAPSDRRIRFSLLAVLDGPENLVGKGRPLHMPLAEHQAEKLQADQKHGILSDAQHRALKRYRDHGLASNWQIPELVLLIPLLSGKDRDAALHKAGIMILDHAERHGDCSGAASLAMALSPRVRLRMVNWFREHSPINIDISRKRRKAFIFKTPEGVHRPFRTEVARRTPI